MPAALRDRLKCELEDMEKKGVIIRESNYTDWVNSMGTVDEGSKLRICLDPRDFNKALKKATRPTTYN